MPKWNVCMIHNSSKIIFRVAKKVKIAVLELQESGKSFWHKIHVAGKFLNFHTLLSIKSFCGGKFSHSASSSDEESYVGSLMIIDFFGRIGNAVETWTKRIWFLGSSFGGGVISIFGTFFVKSTGSAN